MLSRLLLSYRYGKKTTSFFWVFLLAQYLAAPLSFIIPDNNGPFCSSNNPFQLWEVIASSNPGGVLTEKHRTEGVMALGVSHGTVMRSRVAALFGALCAEEPCDACSLISRRESPLLSPPALPWVCQLPQLGMMRPGAGAAPRKHAVAEAVLCVHCSLRTLHVDTRTLDQASSLAVLMLKMFI